MKTGSEKKRTRHQLLGDLGERTVTQFCSCPRCKRTKTLKLLGPNFKAADVICDFCAFTAQVKAVSVRARDDMPKALLGAAWRVQNDRMTAGIYLPLFVVTIHEERPDQVFYVPADLQTPSMFKARNPLRETAKRAGWRGFTYDLSVLPPGIPVKLWEAPIRKKGMASAGQISLID